MIDVGRVEMIDMSKIEINDRARSVYGDLEDLECSLKESGLIQPLAVRDLGNGTYKLLGGERRFLVLKRNDCDKIPVRIYEGELTNLEMKIIEHSENFYRKDFEYWEADNLIREIQELKQKQHGVKAPGPNQEGWSTSDTGELVGISKAAVSTAIKRAEARDAFPELFEGCKNQKDASNVIKKLDEALVKEAIAEKLEKTKSEGRFHQVSKCYIIRDFFKGVKEIPESTYHLVEIDPPYAIDLQKAKKLDGDSSTYNKEDYNEVPKENYINFMSGVFRECYRVMSEHSWLLCWFAPEPWFNDIYGEITNAGFSTTRMCGVWTKHSGQSKRPEIHLANSYEMFFYAWKGRPALNKQGHRNVFDFPPVPAQQKTHPTERPIELMKELYETFAFPGSRILIPFAGSGSGILAAHELGMSPIGFDLTKRYKDSFLVRAHNTFG